MLNIPFHFNEIFPIFIVASCAGIVSMIPGGLGSFDLVLYGESQYLGIENEKILVLLILYRIGYLFIPFLFGLLLFVKEFWKKWNNSWDHLPNTLVQNASHVLLTILVFFFGLISLLSAAVPGIVGRLKFVEDLITFPIISLSHQLSVATGFVLLGLSRGIEYKVKRAYQLTIAVLFFAQYLHFSKDLTMRKQLSCYCSLAPSKVQVPILSGELCFNMEQNHF